MVLGAKFNFAFFIVVFPKLNLTFLIMIIGVPVLLYEFGTVDLCLLICNYLPKS